MPEHRLFLTLLVGTRTQGYADYLIHKTTSLLCGRLPLFVSDGLDYYGVSLINQFHLLIDFEKTGRRGRPRKPKIIPRPDLLYAQVVKERKKNRVSSVTKRIIYGDPEKINKEKISTSLVERENLSLRHDNRRLTRKTIAFSKKNEDLQNQMDLYKAYSNFCKVHHSLFERINEIVHGKVRRKWRKKTPAMSYGITDHVWSMHELMTYKTPVPI